MNCSYLINYINLRVYCNLFLDGKHDARKKNTYFNPFRKDQMDVKRLFKFQINVSIFIVSIVCTTSIYCYYKSGNYNIDD